MKKIGSLLLVLAMCLSMCACGSGGDTPAASEGQAEGTFFEVGQETAVKNFVFTVHEIGFTDRICIDKGDTIGLYSSSGTSVQAEEGHGWLYYSISYQFTGKETLPAQGQFLASGQVEDEYFMTPNLRFFKYDGAWHGLDYQWGGSSMVGLPLPATDMMYQYDPAADKEYELHGAVQVPTTAIEDTETPLIFRLHFTEDGKADEQVNCMVEIKAPAELTPDDRLETFTYEDREFFREYVQGLSPMNEEELRAVLSDHTFQMRNNYGGDGDGSHSITFYADGRLDAKYTFEGEQYTMYESWTIKDGRAVLAHSFTNVNGEYRTSEYALTPFRYDDSRYLLIHQDGDYSMVLTADE